MFSRPIFAVAKAEAVMIRTACAAGCKLSALVELRWVFPGIIGMAKARACVGSAVASLLRAVDHSTTRVGLRVTGWDTL
jgi:hypothetical protein